MLLPSPGPCLSQEFYEAQGCILISKAQYWPLLLWGKKAGSLFHPPRKCFLQLLSLLPQHSVARSPAVQHHPWCRSGWGYTGTKTSPGRVTFPWPSLTLLSHATHRPQPQRWSSPGCSKSPSASRWRNQNTLEFFSIVEDMRVVSQERGWQCWRDHRRDTGRGEFRETERT